MAEEQNSHQKIEDKESSTSNSLLHSFMVSIGGIILFLITVVGGVALTYGLAKMNADPCTGIEIKWAFYLSGVSILLLFLLGLLVPKSFVFKKSIGRALVILFVIGLGAPAASSRNQYAYMAWESDAKSNLQNLYLGCKSYWAEKGSDKECRVDIVSSPEYGYVQSSRVSIFAKGTESDFSATSQHACSRDNKQYTMDAEGNIK